MAERCDDRQADYRAFVEQEHPKRRPAEPEDPMMMTAESAGGDPLTMLDGLVEEFARMGWDAERIGQLFDRPFFRATYGLKQLLGEETVRRRVEETLKRCGVFRFSRPSLEMYGDE